MLKIPVIILTGFLGSGKTTLLNAILENPAFADSALIINEFGDVAIDHDLVRVGSREMMRTSTGCLCCTLGSDVRATLFELHEAARTGAMPTFSRVIIETTGLVDPAPLVNQLLPGGTPAMGLRDHVVARSYGLAGIVTTVDMVTGELAIENHFEATNQIAFADRVVITKTDLARDPVSKKEILALADRLHGLNPAALIVERHSADFDLADLFAPKTYVPSEIGEDVAGWLALDQAIGRDHGHTKAGSASFERHGGRIRSLSIVRDLAVEPEAFDRFFAILRQSAGGRLLRVKGLVGFTTDPDHPRVVHAVQHTVFPPVVLDAWPSEDHTTRLIFITDGIDEKPIRELFEATLDARPVSLSSLLAHVPQSLTGLGRGLLRRLR